MAKRRSRSPGRRLLIGLASYSSYELELAQEIVDRSDQRPKDILLQLFDVLDVQDMDDFQSYIPGVGNVYQTPVIGVWKNGVLTDKAQGFDARQLARRLIFLNTGPR